ncbi:hypothetical protein ACFVY4_00120 [Streptomyces sp. NPDC058299]|uniref:hypothetical protein n=1 Tax=Streptomyces sp. NPDC058299 TaxID=3346435 RepID=UPI0036E7B8B2
MAYAEAEYFGGVGEENAAVWRDGELVLGPLHLAEGEPAPAGGSPVCQVLRALSVHAGQEDEFMAVGLGSGAGPALAATETFRFDSAQVRDPLRDTVLKSGWTWRGVVLGEL